MRTIRVATKEKTYDINIAQNILDHCGLFIKTVVTGTKAVIVTDTNVAPLYAPTVETTLANAGFLTKTVVVPAGEASKSLDMAQHLYDEFLDFQINRNDVIVALGGGVVGDLTGFAAATILRGVPVVQIPTTLLAQVDSSIGAKVGVDLPQGKNLVGTFFDPAMVFTDPTCLTTLSDSVFYDGLAEVIKYAMLFDESLFVHLEAFKDRTDLMDGTDDRFYIEDVIISCCLHKQRLVIQDPYDTGDRMLLNFGHTLGHIYEKAGNYQTWTHGQAISAGMMAAMQIGEKLGLTPHDLTKRLEQVLTKFHLPITLSKPISINDFDKGLKTDKKGAGDTIRFILCKNIGDGLIHEMKKTELLQIIQSIKF